jgi:hypothetical protein
MFKSDVQKYIFSANLLAKQMINDRKKSVFKTFFYFWFDVLNDIINLMWQGIFSV